MPSFPRPRPRRPHAATVLAALALLVALSSPAVAARLVTSADIRDNTVQSVDIRNGGVRGLDVGDGQIRSLDIADRGIGRQDLAPGALNADRLDGLDSASFQRRCAPGSVLAWVQVAGRATFPNAWTTDPAWTPYRQGCTTYPEVRRLSPGVYLVRVPGVDIAQTGAVATPYGAVADADGSLAVQRVTFEGALAWQVTVLDVAEGRRSVADRDFTFAVI